MPAVEVTCITKQHRNSPYEGITHIGGPGGNGWRWPVADVIRSIEAKSNTFYVKVGTNRVEIGVVNGPNGKYLRTYANKAWTDNLLSLPECRLGLGSVAAGR